MGPDRRVVDAPVRGHALPARARRHGDVRSDRVHVGDEPGASQRRAGGSRGDRTGLSRRKSPPAVEGRVDRAPARRPDPRHARPPAHDSGALPHQLGRDGLAGPHAIRARGPGANRGKLAARLQGAPLEPHGVHRDGGCVQPTDARFPLQPRGLALPYLQLPDGVPLYYEEHGAEKPILLLPGWTITTGFWKRQISDLSRDHRVLTFDLRGAGASGKTPDGHTLNAYAADLANFLAAKDLENVTLIAWAMGVSVSVHYLVAQGTE